ncbi:benzoate transporter [Streptomyces sp. NPDC060022]|uniref:benzoate transporter n=1 Tax=Streptomyces sp. NPDC060022 TaxID=3347039 RepID=UPI0036B28656
MEEQADVHRKIAAALAGLVPSDPTIPPHPYLRRHLAEHAAQGDVLDDDHVPPALLAWETSSEVRRLLAGQQGRSQRQQWLQAWARLEPFARGTGPVSRLTSLHLAHHAAGHFDQPVAQAGEPRAEFDSSPVTPLWNDCVSAVPAWTAPPHVVTSMAAVKRSDGTPSGVVLGDRIGMLRLLRHDGSLAHTPLAVHQGAITHLMTLNGGIVVTAGSDGRVCAVDALDGRIIQEVIARREGTWVCSLASYRPPGRLPQLVAAFSDGYVAGFDPGRFLPRDMPLLNPHDPTSVLRGFARPDGQAGLLFSRHNTVRYFDGATDVMCSEHQGRVRALLALDEPGWYAVADEAGTVSLHDATATGRLATTVAQGLHAAPVTTLLKTTFEGRPALVSAAGDGTVRLWATPSMKHIDHELAAHSGPVSAMAFLSGFEYDRLLTAGDDRLVKSWTVERRTFRQSGRWNRVSATALSPQPRHLLAAARASRIVVYDTPTGNQQTLLKDQQVTALAWPHVGKQLRLAAALEDLSIICINPDTKRRIGPVMSGHYLPVLAMVPLPTARGAQLASAGADGRVCVWNLHDGRLLADFKDHKLSVRCLATHSGAHGRLLASGGSDGSVRMWDIARLAQHGKTIKCDQGIINDVAFASGHDGGLRIATAGQNGTLKLWDATTSAQVGELSPDDGDLGAVTALRLPKYKTVVVMAGKTSIHLWDTAADRHLLQIVTGSPVRTLKSVPDPLSEESSVLLASGEAGTMTFRLHHDRL